MASLVLGILGWTLIPTIGSIAAIITGHMAKNEIKESMEDLGGDGMATAGLILGYANIADQYMCMFGVVAHVGIRNYNPLP